MDPDGQGIIMNLRLALLDVRTCATKGSAAECVAFVARIRDFVPVRGRGFRGHSRSVRVGEAKNKLELEEINRFDTVSTYLHRSIFLSSMTLQPSSICGLAAASRATSEIVFAGYGHPSRIPATKSRIFSSSFKNNDISMKTLHI